VVAGTAGGEEYLARLEAGVYISWRPVTTGGHICAPAPGAQLPDTRRAPRRIGGIRSTQSHAPPDCNDDRDAYTIDDVGKRTDTGRTFVYGEIRAGRLRAVKLGRLT
jgi:hypothetical protein